MKVLELRDIQQEEGYIYYRKKFFSTALIEIPQKNIEVPLIFVIETEPTGKKIIDVSLQSSIDYPLLPIIKALKEKIREYDKEGLLI
jgi:hypothetical protein